MLVWDETDVLTVLETIPEIEEDGIWHYYSVQKNSLELKIYIYQYDGDIKFELSSDGIESPIFHMQLCDCSGVLRTLDSSGEYLDFAPAKCFGSRYDGISSIPFGVRVRIKPTINVSLYG